MRHHARLIQNGTVALPIPTYDALMLPVLKHVAKQSWQMGDLVRRIADDLNLSAEDRSALLPGGSTTVLGSRVHWAKTYLKQAGLVEQPKRGTVQITPSGTTVLAAKPTSIDAKFLTQFPSFVRFAGKMGGQGNKDQPPLPVAAQAVSAPAATENSSTPIEAINAAANLIEDALRDSLLARLYEKDPRFFERVILDVLQGMRYGVARGGARQQLGGTADGGVDGFINEDPLGLDRIYLQAKLYKAGNNVGGPAVQAFIGALMNRGAQKGVLITTSDFTGAARQAAGSAGGLRIVLMNGQDLTEAMVRYDVGVRTTKVVSIKDVDSDYFDPSDLE